MKKEICMKQLSFLISSKTFIALKIVFIIGGAYGFNKELNKTVEKISLSKFTFT